ncbi:MAG: hypothetical protein FWE74_07065 [Oscillospiraceae bacterium]|nr:hypothetical protein [Oscillospiraceae bacterium]
MQKKRIKNGEYYTLISAAVLLRTAFYLLTAYIENEDFLYIFYDLGIVDFLLFELLFIIIIGMHFRGKTQAVKILSISWTSLFAVILTHLLIRYAYNLELINPWVIRFVKPLIVYIIPVGIITAILFSVRRKKVGRYLKNSLLKPTSVVFFIACFALVGMYIWLSVTVIYRLENFDHGRRTLEEFFALIEFGEKLIIAEYAVNSLFICGTVICFYRGVRLTDIGIKLNYIAD